MEEALIVGNIRTEGVKGKRVLDVGAAPGGWSQCLLVRYFCLPNADVQHSVECRT